MCSYLLSCNAQPQTEGEQGFERRRTHGISDTILNYLVAIAVVDVDQDVRHGIEILNHAESSSRIGDRILLVGIGGKRCSRLCARVEFCGERRRRCPNNLLVDFEVGFVGADDQIWGLEAVIGTGNNVSHGRVEYSDGTHWSNTTVRMDWDAMMMDILMSRKVPWVGSRDMNGCVGCRKQETR